MTIGPNKRNRLGETVTSGSIRSKQRTQEELDELIAELTGETEIKFQEAKEPFQVSSENCESEEVSLDGD